MDKYDSPDYWIKLDGNGRTPLGYAISLDRKGSYKDGFTVSRLRHEIDGDGYLRTHKITIAGKDGDCYKLYLSQDQFEQLIRVLS